VLEKVLINGLSHKDFSCDISAEEAVRRARATFPIVGDDFPLMRDDPVTIRASGDLLLTGYARDVEPSHDDENHEFAASFVSRTVDATECSVEHEEGWLEKVSLPEIAREFDRLGIGIETDGSTFPKETRHRLALGETLYETLERRARSRGVLIMDTPEGRLKLAQKPDGRHAGGLVLGVNIKSGSAKFTGHGLHSPVIVRGQSTEGVTAPSMRPQGKFTDPNARRRRPLILRHSGEAGEDRLKKRAGWEASRAAGNSISARITVTGWRDGGGRIWQPNWLVHVEDGKLGLNGLMLIKSVSLYQNDDAGTVASLSLVDPRALGGNNPRGKSSDAFTAPTGANAEFEV
jgi:prophage tail gpP-like protein